MLEQAVLALLLAVALLAVAIQTLKLRAARKKGNAAADDLSALKEATSHLWQYQEIADATEEASRVKVASEQHAAQVRLDAIRAKEDAESEAQAVLKEARSKAKATVEKSESELRAAGEQVRKMLERAEESAQEIAGDAWKAKQNAGRYERAARAMKNVIEGYGDEYVVPNHSVLDDLAEDYDHKEAGQRLKEARLESRRLVKTGVAAHCDYVEAGRRQYAIHFVLDAFNGKVDSALSTVKATNFGKLDREIRDAFDLVNHHGQAFRNASISEDYLKSRLQELKWAVAARELQLKEREEQRAIKEAMREEERARREYERALKQAERDEAMLEKAMAEAKAKLEAAGLEQREGFERQLSELEERLAEAEARHERAQSMAQQTRQGHVYIISNIGSFGDDVLKIGLTRRLEPLDRVKELGDASVPFLFDVHAMMFSEDAPALEKALHEKFESLRVNRVNYRKEFFRVPVAKLRAEIENLGLECHWTMTAEAAEYRETKSILAKERSLEGEAESEPKPQASEQQASQE